MHDSHEQSDHHDVITRLYAEEIISAFRGQMKEAERLAEELHNLMASCESSAASEDGFGEMQSLVHWAEDYSAGLAVAGRISRDGNAWLRRLSQRLNKDKPSPEAVRPAPKVEGRRLEAAPPQTASFAGAARQLRKIMPSVEHVWGRFPVRSDRVGNARAQ